jgi:nicotinate-nucleotide adenylyltransferase
VTVVGLLGGSFNPPHVAHALLGLYALETAPIDRLWLVPTWRHAFGKQLAPYDDRLAMCELIAAALGPRAEVSRVEEDVAKERGGESRTLHTIEHLARTQPSLALRLLVGADILAETASWLGWDEVCRRAPPIVIGRGGVTPPPGATISEVTLPAISSTEIRRRLAAGESVADLLPASVIRYIALRGLYR